MRNTTDCIPSNPTRQATVSCPATGEEIEKPTWAEIADLYQDSNRLNWLENNNAKIEPRFGDSPWIGIFWNGTDTGGNTLREAIDNAIKQSGQSGQWIEDMNGKLDWHPDNQP